MSTAYLEAAGYAIEAHVLN